MANSWKFMLKKNQLTCFLFDMNLRGIKRNVTGRNDAVLMSNRLIINMLGKFHKNTSVTK